ncbi:T9SS type A sorting domain-containing protein [Chryseobacterium sp. WG14]|uniref:T9SS type A sorting domain-containing protein n=1 Tax=Chryseobacterium sp. WG14 TaxID=2926909 RepID=UPI00211DA64F|nr:T9SS type A sorting domain-containing protein [Chryseobacterium sp. WG14]MCQ9640353.1 T9SS type A sorting domain-containing protein [Chryseobacterium sp. WG14]
MKTYLFSGSCFMKTALFSLLALLINSLSFAQLDKIYVNSQVNQIFGICLLCSVQNPEKALDHYEGDYASLTIPIGVLARIEQTLIFPELASNFRKATIGIGTANTPVMQLPLGKISIETFNGSISNNDVRIVDNTMLKADPDPKTGTIEFNPSKRFDRIKITLHSGLLHLGDELRIYYAQHSPIPFTTCGTPPLGPLLYYPFDGDLKDKIRGLDLTSTIAPTFSNSPTCGKNLTATHLDSLYIENDLPLAPDRSLTISFLGRTDSLISIRSISDHGESALFTPEEDSINSSQLNHYVIIYANGGDYHFSAEVYRNGKKINDGGVAMILPPYSLLMTVAKGSIDELLVYDRILNPEERHQLTTSYNIPLEIPSFAIEAQKVRSDHEIFTVSPNPTTGQITLSGNILLQDATITLRNAFGREVYQAKVRSKTLELPSTLSGGVYILILQTKDKKVYSRKIILTR